MIREWLVAVLLLAVVFAGVDVLFIHDVTTVAVFWGAFALLALEASRERFERRERGGWR